jgi:cytochrome c553
MRFSSLLLCQFACLFYFLAGCKQAREDKAYSKEPAFMENMDDLVAGCVVCHGVQEAQRGPILNGMELWYLRDQMNKFRSGIRGNNPDNRSEHLMGIGSRNIKTDLEVAYLANWFSSQPAQPAMRTIQGNIQKGKELYERRCISCHGEHGEGNPQLISPSLTHLEGWYFYQQMRKFREGKRGYDPRDEGGRVMAAAVQDLSDYDFRNLIAYSVEEFGLEEAATPPDVTSSDRSPKPF